MNREIADSVIVITGASTGIGRATALKFAHLGASLVVSARREDALRNLAEQCEKLGARALAIPADVTNEEAVRNLARQAAEHFGHIDIWINDAAVSLFGRFEETPPDAFRKVIETNLFGYIHGMRAVLPYFREQGHGTIINVASVVGSTGQPYASAYATSEAAIIGLSESVRMELHDTPAIHVCTILPASVDTPFFQHAANFVGRAVKPMGPLYRPEQVASAIVEAIKHPRAEIMVGNAGKVIATLHKIAPALVERFFARHVGTDHFKENTTPSTEGNLYQPMGLFMSSSGGWREGQPETTSQGRKFLGGTALGIGVALLAAWGIGRRRHLPAP